MPIPLQLWYPTASDREFCGLTPEFRLLRTSVHPAVCDAWNATSATVLPAESAAPAAAAASPRTTAALKTRDATEIIERASHV